MTIKEAIKKAIEGGYRMKFLSQAGYKANRDECPFIQINKEYYLTADLFLDPLFWQSLGKAMGWENFVDAFGNDVESAEATGYRMYQQWVFQWHKFIDHLAEGKTAEDYFKSL